MKKSTLFLSFLLILQSFLLAQQAPQTLTEATPSQAGMSAERLALLDQHIQTFVDQGHVPGGVFLVARRGKVVYNKTFGHRTLDKKKAYQKDDIFRLASMTKAFTTVSIMQLFEQGKLRLDDPVYYYIPAFKESVVLDEYSKIDTSFTTIPAKNDITIRQLLTHTSGITYGVFNPGKIEAIYTKMGANGFGLSDPNTTTEEMANQIAKVPLIFEPGSQYMYGLNMEVLGRIVEVVSKKPLNQYFKDHIFDPLGLKDTDFYLPASKHSRIVPVHTYDRTGKVIMASDTDFAAFFEYPKQSDINHYAGGGGLSGTAMEYAIFIQALLNDGTYNGKRILSRKTIEVMTSDQLISLNREGKGYSDIPGKTFGLGFALTTEAGQAASHKSPGTFEWSGFFNTMYFIDPQEEMIFVGMTQIYPFQRRDFWDKLFAIVYGAIEE